jgi:hypothetical protein
MSNTTETTTEKKTFFEDIKSNASSAKKKYLGDDYPYASNIKSPAQIGVGSKGVLSQLGKNFDGLLAYTQVLTAGGGKASVPKGPMGNKFFLQTGAKCNAIDTNTEVDRHVYINNIPSGKIPFLQGAANLKDLRGLIPGTLGNLNALNPLNLFAGLLDGISPDCQPVTLDVVDINNMKTTETHYVTLTDISIMDPCDFKKKVNPRTGEKCRMGFSNINNITPATITNTDNWVPIIPKDTSVQIFFASIGALTVYLSFKSLQKMGLVPKVN